MIFSFLPRGSEGLGKGFAKRDLRDGMFATFWPRPHISNLPLQSPLTIQVFFLTGITQHNTMQLRTTQGNKGKVLRKADNID